VPLANGKEIEKLIAALDADDFAERDRAATALVRQGEVALPFVEAALHGSPSAEARRQLKVVLTAPDTKPLSPESLRALRSVEVLERIGTPEACAVLDSLAKGDPAARLTSESKESLERLAPRPMK
jgi:hypothetical protein